MERSIIRLAVGLLFSLAATAASADAVATRCESTLVPIDADTSIARLGNCDEAYPVDLLWHLDRIDQLGETLDGRADRGNEGRGSVVYVMDTGVLATHDEFVRPGGTNVIAGYDVATVSVGASLCRSSDKALAPCFSNALELTPSSHGTSVASIIAGRRTGVAPAAKIVSVRVMNERGLATTRNYLAGLNAIIGHAFSPNAPQVRTAVVNISAWVLDSLASEQFAGRVVPYAEVEKKMRQMIDGVDAAGRPDPNGKRFLFVVAANNVDHGCSNGVVDRFPAILGAQVDGVITVGGMTEQNRWWNGGCRGAVEVLAPASNIFSATITGDSDYRGPGVRSGTSFAAPVIAGIAARLLSDRPDLTPQQIEQWIRSTPSRIENPTAEVADGRTAWVRTLEPAVPVAMTSSR